MLYKLIAVDMDGTLLNSQKQISKETVKMIQKCVDAGIIFTICTGRPIQGVRNYADQLNLTCPVITYNGAVIVKADTEAVLFEQSLQQEDAQKIFALGQQYNTTQCIWSGGQLYGNKLNDRIHEYKKFSGVEPLLVEDFDTLSKRGITKILWDDDAHRISQMQEDLKHNDLSEVNHCTSTPNFLEFFSSRVSKAIAMAKLGELYHINREEMVAIGDGLNDLSMIRYAGLGIAMGNAEPAVKAAAQWITDTNNEDGVGEAMERIIYKEVL